MSQRFGGVETFSVHFNKADGGDAIKYASHSFTFPPLRGRSRLYLAASARLVVTGSQERESRAASVLNRHDICAVDLEECAANPVLSFRVRELFCESHSARKSISTRIETSKK